MSLPAQPTDPPDVEKNAEAQKVSPPPAPTVASPQSSPPQATRALSSRTEASTVSVRLKRVLPSWQSVSTAFAEPPPRKRILRWLLPIRKGLARYFIAQTHSFFVVILDSGAVYKRTHPNELDTLRFLAERCPVVPVPRVFDAWPRAEKGGEKGQDGARTAGGRHSMVEIVMQRIQGVPLGMAWLSMPDEEKGSVLRHLKELVDTLRSIQPDPQLLTKLTGRPPNETTTDIESAFDLTTDATPLDGPQLSVPPATHICSTLGGPCLDIRVSTSGEFGPFADERTFNDYLIGRLKGMQTASQLRTLSEHMRDDHAIVFTHGDLVPRNIIVHNARVAGIVDWEQAGWRPEWWEWSKSLYDFWDAMWPKELHKVLTPYEDELAVDLQLREMEDFPM